MVRSDTAWASHTSPATRTASTCSRAASAAMRSTAPKRASARTAASSGTKRPYWRPICQSAVCRNLGMAGILTPDPAPSQSPQAPRATRMPGSRTSRALLGEQLAQILERLEFQGIAAGIEQEHGRLLAHLALEAHIGLDDELRTEGLQAFRQGFPLIPFQDDAEMRHRHVVSVHRIGVGVFLGCRPGMLVDHELVAVEVEIHPLRAGPAFFQAEDLAVEAAGGRQVVHRDGQMEGGQAHGMLRETKGLGLDNCSLKI